jgi:predicted ATP-binding protein involved in virulence
MNVVDSVVISGFWATRAFRIRFHRDVNFLIGPNGSGKPTAINLIAAALNADFMTLDRLQFSSIQISLSTLGKRTRPSMEVEKTETRKTPFPAITYKIKDTASDRPVTYSLEELEEAYLREVHYRYYEDAWRGTNRGVREHLNRIVNVSWLSVQRSAALTRTPEGRNYASAVDKKIHDLNNDLVRYFSSLAKENATEVQRFKEFIFLSLLLEQKEEKLFSLV